MGTDSNKSVAARLQVRVGHSIHLVNAPEHAALLLGQLPNGARLVSSAGDVTLLFVGTNRELQEHLAEALRGAHGVLWVAYPKIASGVSNLSRQVVHDAIAKAGWKSVSQISVDDTWSAIRARVAG